MPGNDRPLLPEDPLIEAATRPLANNLELRFAAAGFLESIRKPDATAEKVAIARWAEVDGRRRMVSWQAMLCLLVLVAAAVVALADWRDVMDIVRPHWDERNWEETQDEFETRFASGLTAEQRILMFGDLSTKDPVKRKEALWKSQPNNPAFLAEYFTALLESGSAIPNELLAHAKKIDPDNAWFTYVALAADARDCVERVPGSSNRVSGKFVRIPASWKIKDQVRLARIVDALKAASGQVKCEHYHAEQMRRRLPLLHDGSFRERCDSIRYLESNVGEVPYLMMGLMDAMAAKAWQAGENGDVEVVRDLSVDAEKLLHSICSPEPRNWLDEYRIGGFAARIAKDIMPAAEKLGLINEAEHWRWLQSRLDGWDRGRSARNFYVDGRSYERGVKSGLLRITHLESLSCLVVNQPKLSDADVRPLRLIDHEIGSRLCAYALVAVLPVLAGLISLYRYRFPKLIRALAGRIQDLFRPVDWLWVFGMGLVLPLLFVLAVNRFTPFGGRDFGLLGSYLILPPAHFVALLMLWLMVPPSVIRWRLSKRAGVLVGDCAAWWVWMVPILLLISFVPVAGWAATTGVVPQFWVERFDWFSPTIDGRTSEAPLWVAAALLVLPVGWLFFSAGFSFLVNGRMGLERLLITRAMLPVLAVGMLLALSLTPLFKLAEQQWYTQDRLMKFDPAQPGWSRYEYQVAVQMRKELRGILGYPE